MIGPNFADEIDCSSFFDHIDDLLDFPNEDIDAALPGGSDSKSFPSIWTTQSESLHGSDSVFSNNSSTDLSAELSVPYEDIVQLEWLSNFVEDSFTGGGGLTMNKQDSGIIKKEDSASQNQFRTSSPVSVLESSSSCSGEKPALCSPDVFPSGKHGRARSKRPRPATFNPRAAIQLVSPTSSITEAGNLAKVPSDSENFAESRLVIKIPRQFNTEHKKKKKIKSNVPRCPADTDNQNPNPPQQQTVRKCMHCEITKTPQWRAGPMGPKTLCNACGVRYKSGRLYPEYRPAASPTFVPALHSNSHKKVLEMRSKGGDIDNNFLAGIGTVIEDDSPELIPNNTNHAMDYM